MRREEEGEEDREGRRRKEEEGEGRRMGGEKEGRHLGLTIGGVDGEDALEVSHRLVECLGLRL